MHLVSFSVRNYRSITKAHKIPIGRSTILIGPNNEGKSNLLRGLVTSMHFLKMPKERLERIPVDPTRRLYDWERDFPVPLQADTPNGESVFTLEFELTEEDVNAFWTEVRSRINGTLPVQVAVGRKPPVFRIPKRGPGAKVLSQKRDQIAAFVASRIDIQHIPAVRTAESALDVVEVLVSRELRKLDDDPQYQSAVNAIGQLQKPVLESLSASIKQTLAVFLPDVTEVAVQMPTAERFRALRRSMEILVDDGTKTALQHKGDGVQSLAALALTRHLSESGSLGKHLLVAIEEPEAHLHPRAIHQVRAVLKELAARHRLVIATHCPLFVDRSDIRNNILVAENRARPAKNIDEVRSMLGVRASDNLKHAELVLLVEGADDKAALDALLRTHSAILRSALDEGGLVVHGIGGASNMCYEAGLIRDALCELHLFLDADRAGKDSAEEIVRQGIATTAEINYAAHVGMAECEIEDLYDVDAYKEIILERYNVRLDLPGFRGNKKWSVRAKEEFQRQGQTWDDARAVEVKTHVARAVVAKASEALESNRRGSFDALVRVLEQRVSKGASLETANQ